VSERSPQAKVSSSTQSRSGRSARPKDAATLVLIDRDGPEPRVLFGRRRPDQVFVPDKFVFPGGRVEAADARVPTPHELTPQCEANLLFDMKGRASAKRARAIALAAIRETFEETGYLLGTRVTGSQGLGTRSDVWAPFAENGVAPDVRQVRFVARAITPPGRTRRYDTRFFLAFADAVHSRVGDGDGEFSELAWLTFDEARGVDLHAMTRTVLDDIADMMEAQSKSLAPCPVPYYVSRHGVFQRQTIQVKTAESADKSVT